MNILLINHYAGSPGHGMEYRPFYLAREWVRLGHNVTIVAATFSHLRRVAPDCKDTFCEEVIEGIRYFWLPAPGYLGNGTGRVVNIFTFVGRLFAMGRRLAADIKPDIVIASSTYPFDIYPAIKIARLAGARLVFEVHDLWPLTLIELNGMSPWHPFIMVMQRAENHAYRKADSVVSMLPKADNYMLSHGMAPEKFAYIPNGFAIEEWQDDAVLLPQQHQELLDGLSRQGRFILGYAGSHGLSNALEQLIGAACMLKGHPVSIVLVGQGPEKEALQRRAAELALTDMHFLPSIPKTAIPSLLSRMDALYIGWSRKPIYRFGICPNKLIDYMMAAKPIIHAVDAGNDLVAESGCGISVAPEDPAAIAAAVTKLLGMTVIERESLGLLGREFVLQNHDYRVLAQKFLRVIE